MKFKVDKERFAAALPTLTAVARGDATGVGLGPIVGFLFDEDGVVLFSNDGSTSAEVIVPAEFEDTTLVKFSVSLGVLSQAVRACGEDTIEFTLDKGFLTLKSGKFRAKLATRDTVPLAAFIVDSPVYLFEGPYSLFKDWFDSVSWLPADSTAPRLGWVHLIRKADRVEAVSSNGYSLMAVTSGIDPEAFPADTLALPKKSLSVFSSLPVEDDDEIKLFINEGGTRVGIASGGIAVTSPTEAKVFPDYSKILDSARGHYRTKISRNEALRLIETMRGLSTKSTSSATDAGVVLNVDSQGEITASVDSGTHSAEDRIDHAPLDDEEVNNTIQVAVHVLSKAIRVLDNKEDWLVLGIPATNDPPTPIIFEDRSSYDRRFLIHQQFKR